MKGLCVTVTSVYLTVQQKDSDVRVAIAFVLRTGPNGNRCRSLVSQRREEKGGGGEKTEREPERKRETE